MKWQHEGVVWGNETAMYPNCSSGYTNLYTLKFIELYTLQNVNFTNVIFKKTRQKKTKQNTVSIYEEAELLLELKFNKVSPMDLLQENTAKVNSMQIHSEVSRFTNPGI